MRGKGEATEQRKDVKEDVENNNENEMKTDERKIKRIEI
jgi:hypothetical protein